MILTFILLGIMALTTGTSFGAVVNSILPLAAGGALGGGAAAGASAAEEAEREGGGKFGKGVDEALEDLQPAE